MNPRVRRKKYPNRDDSLEQPKSRSYFCFLFSIAPPESWVVGWVSSVAAPLPSTFLAQWPRFGGREIEHHRARISSSLYNLLIM